MQWRACLSDRGFDPLLRLVKRAGQPNRPCTASIQAGLRRAALPYQPIVLVADARTPGAPGVIGEHSRSEAARGCMWTDGVVIYSPRFDDAASFAKPVKQMLVEALLGCQRRSKTIPSNGVKVYQSGSIKGLACGAFYRT